jgi:hypothetical protein
MNLIAYSIIRFLFFAFYVFITSPFLGILDLGSKFLDAHDPGNRFRWALAIPGVLWIAAVAWMANDTARHYVLEGQSVFKSIRLSLGEARFRLSFLPLVGSWFGSPKDENGMKRDDD